MTGEIDSCRNFGGSLNYKKFSKMENAPVTNKGTAIGMVVEQRQMIAKFNQLFSDIC